MKLHKSEMLFYSMLNMYTVTLQVFHKHDLQKGGDLLETVRSLSYNTWVGYKISRCLT